MIAVPAEDCGSSFECGGIQGRLLLLLLLLLRPFSCSCLLSGFSLRPGASDCRETFAGSPLWFWGDRLEGYITSSWRR